MARERSTTRATTSTPAIRRSSALSAPTSRRTTRCRSPQTSKPEGDPETGRSDRRDRERERHLQDDDRPRRTELLRHRLVGPLRRQHPDRGVRPLLEPAATSQRSREYARKGKDWDAPVLPHHGRRFIPLPPVVFRLPVCRLVREVEHAGLEGLGVHQPQRMLAGVPFQEPLATADHDRVHQQHQLVEEVLPQQ
jgi:hypothetical protein